MALEVLERRTSHVFCDGTRRHRSDRRFAKTRWHYVSCRRRTGHGSPVSGIFRSAISRSFSRANIRPLHLGPHGHKRPRGMPEDLLAAGAARSFAPLFGDEAEKGQLAQEVSQFAKLFGPLTMGLELVQSPLLDCPATRPCEIPCSAATSTWRRPSTSTSANSCKLRSLGGWRLRVAARNLRTRLSFKGFFILAPFACRHIRQAASGSFVHYPGSN